MNAADVIQAITLLVLAASVYVSYRQTKAAESTVRLSTEQLHGAYRPVIDAMGIYGANLITFTFRNVGNTPALLLTASYRSGSIFKLEALAPGETMNFLFQYSLNQIPEPVGSPEDWQGWKNTRQKAPPLRLDYKSVTGASCWTNLKFSLGGAGTVDLEMEYDLAMPPARK